MKDNSTNTYCDAGTDFQQLIANRAALSAGQLCPFQVYWVFILACRTYCPRLRRFDQALHGFLRVPVGVAEFAAAAFLSRYDSPAVITAKLPSSPLLLLLSVNHLQVVSTTERLTRP